MERKPVPFKKGGEERTATIDVKDYDPFEITFIVPRGSAYLDLSIDCADSAMGADASRGVAICMAIARHLKKWSLPEPVTFDSISDIGDPTVLFAIFNTITNAGDEVKN